VPTYLQNVVTTGGAQPAPLASSCNAAIFTPTLLPLTAVPLPSTVVRSVPDASRTQAGPNDPPLQDKAGPTPAFRSVSTLRTIKNLKVVKGVYAQGRESNA
jgi:hypothetical protein